MQLSLRPENPPCGPQWSPHAVACGHTNRGWEGEERGGGQRILGNPLTTHTSPQASVNERVFA